MCYVKKCNCIQSLLKLSFCVKLLLFKNLKSQRMALTFNTQSFMLNFMGTGLVGGVSFVLRGRSLGLKS